MRRIFFSILESIRIYDCKTVVTTNYDVLENSQPHIFVFLAEFAIECDGYYGLLMSFIFVFTLLNIKSVGESNSCYKKL